jgi:hypothetical protein
VDKFRAVHFLHVRGFTSALVLHCQPKSVTLSGGRMNAAGSRWQSRQKAHAQRFGVAHLVHLVNAPVAFHATDAAATWTEWLK